MNKKRKKLKKCFNNIKCKRDKSALIVDMQKGLFVLKVMWLLKYNCENRLNTF